MPESNKDPAVWAPVIERATWQIAYRQLGIVALPCGMNVASKAVDLLCQQGKGRWRWLLENRVLVWEGIPIDHALTFDAYVVGGKARQKNTVFCRVAFWRMYFFELGLRQLERLRGAGK